MKFYISYRLILGSLLVMALALAGGLIIIAYTYKLQEETTLIIDTNVQSLRAAQDLEIALFKMRGLTYNYIIDRSPEIIRELQQRENQFTTALELARKSANTKEEENLIKQITALYTNYEQDLKTALFLEKQGQNQKANVILIHASKDLFGTIYDKCEIFVRSNEAEKFDYEEKIKSISVLIRKAMYMMGIGGIVLGLTLGWAVTRSILKPIYQLVFRVKGAGGAFIESVKMTPGKELKEIDNHIRNLVEGMNKAQEDLEKNKRLLERSNRLAVIGKAAPAIAHELRNPLAAIKMLIYSMRDDKSDPAEKQQDLEIIGKEIDRMESFIQNFLNFAKPSNPQFVMTDVSQVVQETLQLLGPRIRQNNIVAETDFSDKTKTILADPQLLKQVLLNLFLNAIEAMGSEGKLEISMTRQVMGDRKNGRDIAQIHISDTGPGISEELKEVIFDPFVKGKDHGVGLGLSISQKLVELHHGWIDVENNQEKGATFTINIPVRHESEIKK